MPQIPIIMPQLGESIAEATVIGFLVQPGDAVNADQDVLEVETNKASMNVSSPARGKVHQWLAKRDESYPVGAVLGYLEVTEEEAKKLGLDAPAPPQAGASVPQGNGIAGAGARRGRKLHVAAHEGAHQ
jgi:pyruvate/2-oxoglutarate dehydrogenase complex dihydrolipoamide acyltransferase (E2) component